MLFVLNLTKSWASHHCLLLLFKHYRVIERKKSGSAVIRKQQIIVKMLKWIISVMLFTLKGLFSSLTANLFMSSLTASINQLHGWGSAPTLGGGGINPLCVPEHISGLKSRTNLRHSGVWPWFDLKVSFLLALLDMKLYLCLKKREDQCEALPVLSAASGLGKSHFLLKNITREILCTWNRLLSPPKRFINGLSHVEHQLLSSAPHSSLEGGGVFKRRI